MHSRTTHSPAYTLTIALFVLIHHLPVVITGKGIDVPAGGAVTYEKHHASDWLPTLVSMAAGEDWQKHVAKDEPAYLLGDGVNNWEMLSSGGKKPSGALCTPALPLRPPLLSLSPCTL
jgi:hypothetical protein